MKSAFFCMICMIFILGCSKYQTPANTPKCINDAVHDFAKNATCSDPSITEYKFQGAYVYVFAPGTCGADMLSAVQDANCNHIGDLGGIAGNTIINGASFSSAEFIRIIWQAEQ